VYHQFKCSLCDKSFKFQRSLRQHNKKAHDVVPKVLHHTSCPVCEETVTFSSIQKLENHLTESHGFLKETKTKEFASLEGKNYSVYLTA